MMNGQRIPRRTVPSAHYEDAEKLRQRLAGPVEVPIEDIVGHERRKALPIPASFLEGLVSLEEGAMIRVPEDIVISGLRAAKVMERKAAAFAATHVRSNAQLSEFQRAVHQLLADTYTEQAIANGNPMIFVAGEYIMPIPSEPEVPHA